MRPQHLAILLAVAGLPACTPAPDPQQATGSYWEGELRIMPGDTSFAPCGSLVQLKLTGPGLDSLARRYAWLRTMEGQWVKTWLQGHMAAHGPAGRDSMLVATAYGHMDIAVDCPLVPVDSLAGHYRAEATAPSGTHVEELDFLPDGRALIITTKPQLYAEVDGSWGMDHDHDIMFRESRDRFRFIYIRQNGALVRPLPNGNMVSYRHTGPARPLAGAFGRVAKWMQALKPGEALDPLALRPTMRIDSLFPDAAAQGRLYASVADTLALGEGQMARLKNNMTTLGDLAALLRSQKGH